MSALLWALWASVLRKGYFWLQGSLWPVCCGRAIWATQGSLWGVCCARATLSKITLASVCGRAALEYSGITLGSLLWKSFFGLLRDHFGQCAVEER